MEKLELSEERNKIARIKFGIEKEGEAFSSTAKRVLALQDYLDKQENVDEQDMEAIRNLINSLYIILNIRKRKLRESSIEIVASCVGGLETYFELMYGYAKAKPSEEMENAILDVVDELEYTKLLHVMNKTRLQRGGVLDEVDHLFEGLTRFVAGEIKRLNVEKGSLKDEDLLKRTHTLVAILQRLNALMNTPSDKTFNRILEELTRISTAIGVEQPAQEKSI